MELPLADIVKILPDSDKVRWFILHGTPTPDSHVRLNCACTALTNEGRCSIYDDRPQMCRDYERGGAWCLEAIRRRRTPQESAEIRKAGFVVQGRPNPDSSAGH